MALGKKLFQWNASDIVKGVSSSDAIADGGFSPLTDAVQITNTPGIMYQTQFPTDKSTGLTGEMIASCEDPSGHYQRLYTSSDVSQNGRYWSIDGSGTLTQRGSTDSSHAYIQGSTDMIAYEGEVYITSQSEIIRWSSIGASNTFANLVSFNDAFAPHPALAYNSFAYYGDGNLLLRASGAGVAPTTILTLDTGAVIVALGIDPGSGEMLISIVGQPEISDMVNTLAQVAFYDGFSPQVTRYVTVENMVTAFVSTEGAMFCPYGQNLGQWNGSGVTFLRNFSNIQFDNTQLMYKHHFTTVGSTLFFIVRDTVMAYGEVRQKSAKVFYPAYNNTNSTGGGNLTNIANIGSNIVSISYATSKFGVWDSFGIGGTPNQINLFTNSYDFDDEVWVRRARVIWQNKVTSNTRPGTISFLNENGLISGIGDLSGGTFSLLNTSGASNAYIDILNINVKVKMLQVKMALDTGNFGIRRIIVYGDPANITAQT